jgi:4-hydroxybenzoate polyprenyltransferase
LPLIVLFRVWNALFAAGVCVYSFWIVKFSVSLIDVAILSLGVFFLVAFANAHNDIVDFKIDKINRPKRPLPSGKLSIEQAYTAAFICFFWAMILGVMAGWKFVILFAVVGVLSFIYNKYLKKLPLVGNFAVALLTCTPIFIPIIKITAFSQLIILAFFAFILTFAREIIKDIEDMAGDKALGLKTFPLLSGIKPSLAIFFLALAMPAILYPKCWAGVAAFIGFSAIFVFYKKWRCLQGMLKLAMVAGLAIFPFF